MKVNFDKINKQNTTFEGYKPVKDAYGNKGYLFNYPFDSNKYDCYLELVRVTDKNDDGYFEPDGGIKNVTENSYSIPIPPGGKHIDLDLDYRISPNEPFAYHYRLVDKNNGAEKWVIDAGEVINKTFNGPAHEIYNVVDPKGADLVHGGAMKLIIPDSYRPGFVYDKDGKIIYDKNIAYKTLNSVRTFSNKMGGTLAGIEKDIDDNKFDNITRLISTPLFTDDKISHHGYWNKNPMQLIQSLGNINNYASIQRKLFGKGINWVSDGAFVNEGLQGVHFQHILKWGDQSPYYKWFRIQDGPILLAVLPNFEKNLENVGYKVINPSGKDKNGKPAPTYFQIFDKRLVSDVDAKDTSKLIESYEKLNTDNLLDINTYEDTVIPYYFEISPKEYAKNLETLKSSGVKEGTPEALKILGEYTNFNLVRKIEGGIETWDANGDIPKLNYVTSNTDTRNSFNEEIENRAEKFKELEENNYMVQDLAVSSGKFWTKKTSQILTLHAAQNLNKTDIENTSTAMNTIKDNIRKGIFPKRLEENISENVVDNVLNGEYQLKGIQNKDEYKNQILSGLMDLPLDSIEVGDNIVSVLASPYISKRATKEDEVGVSRYDLYNGITYPKEKGVVVDQDGKEIAQHIPYEYKETYKAMNKVYTEEMYKFADNILEEINKKLPQESKLYDGLNATDYGKYVIPILTSEIAKFAVIKSFAPRADVKFSDKGEVSYDYNKLKNISLQSIGITNASSPEDEAHQVIGKIRDGIRSFKDKQNKNYSRLNDDKKHLIEGLYNSIKDTDLNSFALAEVVVDRSETGLDWRIDATKDISDIDSMRSKQTHINTNWDQVYDFWNKFNTGVLNENPNAYMVAEMTDEFDVGNIAKFIRKTGMTSTANYKFFFTDIPILFAKTPENGKNNEDIPSINRGIYDKMIGHDRAVNYGPLKTLINSYTFASNHDKPRILQGLAVDMEFFHINDLNNAPQYFKDIAHKIVKNEYYPPHTSIGYGEFDNLSAKDIAMADAVENGFTKYLENKDGKGTLSKKSIEIQNAVRNSLQDIVNLSFDGKNIDAEAFGVKPIDVTIGLVLDQAEKQHGLKLTDEERKELNDAVFKTIMDPAMKRMIAIFKFFAALPGMPTLFSGDDLAASGYETPCKNVYLQNRGANHWQWVEDEKNPFYKEFVANNKAEIDKTLALRKRPELHPLNDGAIFTLKQQKTHNGMEASAILRQSTDGAMTISVFNTAGINNHDPKNEYNPIPITLDKIDLNSENDKAIGLHGGIQEGLKFVNANNPNEIYYTRIDKDGSNTSYHLKKHVNGQDVPIPVTDTTLILYHIPDPQKTPAPSFMGSKVMYNPKYNFVSNPYKQAQTIVSGSKLAIVK